MKAFLINPAEQSIQEVEVTTMADVENLIGFDSVISDEISNSSDCLFFDEDCFIRATPGRFQLDKLPPVAGCAVVMGLSGNELQEVGFSKAELTGRVVFL